MEYNARAFLQGSFGRSRPSFVKTLTLASVPIIGSTIDIGDGFTAYVEGGADRDIVLCVSEDVYKRLTSHGWGPPY